MTFSRRLPGSASLLLLLLTVTPALAQKPAGKAAVEIKLATLAPEGSTWMKTMHKIDDDVRVKTENRVGFKFFPGGVQGDEKDVIRKMRNGQVHGAAFTGFGLGSIVPEVRVLELPFMFDNLDELDYVRAQTNDYYTKAFDDKGYALLGWTDVGFVYLFTKNPVRGPNDMAAQKWWIWSGDPLAEIFYKAFKIAPIPLAAPDVLTSLQTGVVDAVYSPPLACVALQWYSRVKFMTDVPVTHGISAVLVSKKALAGVSDADLAAIEGIARTHLADLTAKTRVQNNEAIEEIKKEGVQVVAVDPATRKEFTERGRAAWSEGVGTLYSQELLDRVKKLVVEFRAAHAKP